MVNALSDVDSNILDCKTAIEEFNNELLELNWNIFERVQTEFGNLNSEMDNLVGLFDAFNDIKVSDGKGTWTKEAVATLGLYAEQYELAQYQIQQYGDAIKRLNADYLEGKYSATEYMDKLAELNKEQWDAVNSAESLEDAIISLNETRVNEEIDGIEKEIDAFKELTDAQIKALEATKDLHDYQQSIAEKTKNITDLEHQIAAMQNDNTAATVAKRKQLEEQLAKAKNELEDAQYEHSIDAQKEALNQQYEDYEANRNAEIEALKLSLEDREALLAQSFETVKANASTVGEEIAIIAQEHGVIVSNAVITPWQNGEGAIANYGAVLSEQSSAFIGTLMGVEGEIYNLQTQANYGAESIANMFSTRADNLVNELISSYNSEANLNAMTNTLQNSLIETLERGYNINSITDGLGSIASAANDAANAARDMYAALSSGGSYSGGSYTPTSSTETKSKSTDRTPTKNTSSPTKSKAGAYSLVDANTGDTVESGLTLSEAQAKASRSTMRVYQVKKTSTTKLKAYAKGSKYIDKDQLAWTQDKGDEIIIRPTDGAILTRLNKGDGVVPANLTDNLFDWGAINPSEFIKNWNPTIDFQSNLPEIQKVEQQPNVTIHYDKMFEFNGNFNDTNQLLRQMEKTAAKSTQKILSDINTSYKYNRGRR